MATTMRKKVADTFGQLNFTKADWSIERQGDKMWLHTPQGRVELPLGFFGQTRTGDRRAAIVAKGLASGLAGTAAVMLATRALALTTHEEEAEGQPQEFGPPRQEARRQEPTDVFVERAAAAIGQQVTDEQLDVVDQARPWLYGGFWGMVYGLAQTSLRLPEAPHGALLGAAVFGMGPRLVFPHLKLTAREGSQDARGKLTDGAMHLLYGVVTAYTFKLMSRRR